MALNAGENLDTVKGSSFGSIRPLCDVIFITYSNEMGVVKRIGERNPLIISLAPRIISGLSPPHRQL